MSYRIRAYDAAKRNGLKQREAMSPWRWKAEATARRWSMVDGVAFIENCKSTRMFMNGKEIQSASGKEIGA